MRALASTKERKPLSDYEVVVPFSAPRGRARPVSRVRSTLITASLVALRQMGFEERYYRALPQERHEELHSLVAGTWVSLELAAIHYTACDSLGLTATEMTQLGEDVSQRTQKSFVATLAKASVLFSNAHRIWERVFEGGDIASYKLGPKEAYVEVAGCPLLALPYFRAAFRAYFRAVVALLSQVAYTHEVVAYGSESGAVFRFSWA